MFIGEIDLRTGVLEYCNCGHNPPVVGEAEPSDDITLLCLRIT